jgi:hypothetical protein
VSFERESAEERRHERTGAGQYIGLPPWSWRSLHLAEGQGLIADELVLELTTFLRSLERFSRAAAPPSLMIA